MDLTTYVALTKNISRHGAMTFIDRCVYEIALNLKMEEDKVRYAVTLDDFMTYMVPVPKPISIMQEQDLEYFMSLREDRGKEVERQRLDILRQREDSWVSALSSLHHLLPKAFWSRHEKAVMRIPESMRSAKDKAQLEMLQNTCIQLTGSLIPNDQCVIRIDIQADRPLGLTMDDLTLIQTTRSYHRDLPAVNISMETSQGQLVLELPRYESQRVVDKLPNEEKGSLYPEWNALLERWQTS